MPNIRKKTSSDYLKQPWKNGGGETQEILVYPQAIGFQYRLSLATIEKSGPFSNFEGYMRVLVPLEGGLSLKHGSGSSFRLDNMRPYKFDGAMPTEAILQTPQAWDFNVIYDPMKVGVEVNPLVFSGSLPLTLVGNRDLLFCVAGEVQVRALGTTRLAINDLCDLQATALDQKVDLVFNGSEEAKLIHVSITNK